MIIMTTKLTQHEEHVDTHCLLMALAVANLHEQATGSMGLDDTARAKELLELISEQSKDDTGRAKGEYLGGNGKTRWEHCKGRDMADKLTLSDDLDYDSKKSLDEVVHSRQGSIVANGIYNVRFLARWRDGYNPEKAAEDTVRTHRKLLNIRATDSRDSKRIATREQRKQARLARLRASKGKK